MACETQHDAEFTTQSLYQPEDDDEDVEMKVTPVKNQFH